MNWWYCHTRFGVRIVRFCGQSKMWMEIWCVFCAPNAFSLYCLLEFVVLSLSAGDCIWISCAFSSFLYAILLCFPFSNIQLLSLVRLYIYRKAHGVPNTIRHSQSNYSFESIFTFAAVYIFSAECSVKSACSSISIDCVKQSLSCTLNGARTY